MAEKVNSAEPIRMETEFEPKDQFEGFISQQVFVSSTHLSYKLTQPKASNYQLDSGYFTISQKPCLVKSQVSQMKSQKRPVRCYTFDYSVDDPTWKIFSSYRHKCSPNVQTAT